MKDLKKKIVVHREITIPDFITVKDLAHRITVKSSELIEKLTTMGISGVTSTYSIERDIAKLIASEFGCSIKTKYDPLSNQNLFCKEDHSGKLSKTRPPIVTFMGHVDHGKTSLLDSIRRSNIVEGEAGGITQHIGAYQVTMHDGKKITFIDTPGHASFKAMRARGSSLTDIIVLVIAADDGVKEQTIEAISHAREARVPIIVVINKIDKSNSVTSGIRGELLRYGILLEEFGGDTMVTEVSARLDLNIEDLKEKILVISEMMDLKARLDCPAVGIIIEAKIDKTRGALATVLVQNGTLYEGDSFVTGRVWGRVRSLFDEKGKPVISAFPSQPVEICGMAEISAPGNDFFVVENESTARKITKYRYSQYKKISQAKFESRRLFEPEDKERFEISLVIKGDTLGSVEAILNEVKQLNDEKTSIYILSKGVGTITQGDINLAGISSGKIFGFNVQVTKRVRILAKKRQVEIFLYSTIYELLDNIKSVLSRPSQKHIEKRSLGQAEIRHVFNVQGEGRIAGCYVTDGVIKRGSEVQIIRGESLVYTGKIRSLRRVKDETVEVRSGLECGASFIGYQNFQEGDSIKCFETKEIIKVFS